MKMMMSSVDFLPDSSWWYHFLSSGMSSTAITRRCFSWFCVLIILVDLICGEANTILAAESRTTGVSGGLTVVGTGATLPQQLYAELINAYKVASNDKNTPGAAGNSSGLVSLRYTGTGSGAGQIAVKANQVDFAGSDSLLLDSDYVTYPDLQMYPTVAAAVVLIFNIPTLLSTDELILTRPLLSKIYLGDIRLWNDPEILQANPSLSSRLPSEPISLVVRADKSGTTEIFTSGLTSFDTSRSNQTRFGIRIGVSATPDWCELGVDSSNTKQVVYGNGYGASSTITCHKSSPSGVPLTYLAGLKEDGVAALVRTTPNSIGYLVLSEAIISGLPYTSMINKAGKLVRPNDESVSFAVLQNAGFLDDRMNLQLVDSVSGHAWPLAGATYLVLRQKSSNATCFARRALVNLWKWFYESPAAEKVTVSLGFTTMPPQVRQRAVKLLTSQVMCCDDTTAESPATGNCTRPSYTEEKNPALVIAKGDDVSVGVLQSAGFMLNAVTKFTMPSVNISPLKQQTESLLLSSGVQLSDPKWSLLARLGAFHSQLKQSLEANQSGPPSAGIFLHSLSETFVPQQRPATTSSSQSASVGREFVTLPLFALAVGPLYHVSAIDTSSGTHSFTYRQLVVTGETLASIYTGSITTWDNTAIQAQNAHLFGDSTIANGLAGKPIKVLLLAADSMINYVYSEYLSSVSVDFKSQIGIQTSFRSLASRLGSRAILVQSSSEMRYYLAVNDYVIGYDSGMTSSIIEQPFGIGLLPRASSPVSKALYASQDTLWSCLNGTNGDVVTTLGRSTSVLLHNAISLGSSTEDDGLLGVACWPIVLSGALTIRTAWTGDSCAEGKALAAFAEWLILEDIISVAGCKFGAVALTSPGLSLSAPPADAGQVLPNVTSLLVDALSAVECDGSSFLRPLPVCTTAMMTYTISPCSLRTLHRTVSFKFQRENMCRGGASLPQDYKISCDNLPFYSYVGLFCQVLFIFGVVGDLAFVYWTYRHRHALVIVRSQKHFQFLFGFGCCGLHLTILIFLGPNDPFTCILRPWSFSVISTIAFVPLIAKLHRLHKVFTTVSVRASISNWALMRRVVGLVMVDVLLLAIWTAIDLPSVQQTPIPVAGMTLSQAAGRLRGDSSLEDYVSSDYYAFVCTTTSSKFFWILTAWKAALIGSGILVTIRTWKLDEKFSDARWLALMIYNTFLLSSLCLLLNFLLIHEDGAMQTLCICITIFMIGFISILLQTGPKMYKYYHDAEAKISVAGPSSSTE